MGVSHRYKIIVNPTAGRGAAKRSVPRITQALDHYGLVYDLAFTRFPWHAAELAQAAIREGFDTVVPVGGDGTVNEAMNGILRYEQEGKGSATLGVLPIGGGNDFAFGMGIPLDLQSSCKVLAEHHAHPVDVGYLSGGAYPEGRFFGNGVGIGFDAVVSFIAAQKRLRGFLGYLIAAIQTIYRHFKSPLVEISLNGKSITQSSLMVSVMNGQRMAGGFMMAPQAIPTDGLFDLLIADEVSPAVIWQLIPRFLKGTQFGHPAIQVHRAPRVAVRALKGELPAHADGEKISEGCDQITIEIVPQAIKLVCPQNSRPVVG